MSAYAPRGLLLALGFAALSGCSLIAKFENECSVDGDCSGTLRCVEQLCVERTVAPTPDAAPQDDGPTPDRGATPTDMGMVDGAGGGGGGGLPLTPELCHTLYGVSMEDALSDRTILLGMLMPRTGDLGPTGRSIELAAVLALEEINEIGGLDGKRFGIVACDTAGDPEQGVRAAQWLVDYAHVPAIIGPAASSVTIRVFNDVAKPNGVVIISPSSTAPSIATVSDEQDLLWRTAPSDALQGAAVAAYLLDKGFTKIAVINRDDTYGNGLVAEIRGPLCQVGRCGEENLFNRRYPEGADAMAFTPIVADLLRFLPEAIVLISFVDDGIAFLNTAGAFDGLDRFILTDGARDISLLDQVRPGIIDRIIGTAPSSPASRVYQDFAFAYTSKWGMDPSVFNAQSYDAMYLLAYAIAGLPADAPRTGPAVALQLRRLSQGTQVTVGPAAWNDTARLLRTNPEATIDFDGASGPLNFDETGEAPADIEGWRFDRPAGRIRSLGVIYTAAGVYVPVVEPGPDAGAPPPQDAGVPAPDGG